MTSELTIDDDTDPGVATRSRDLGTPATTIAVRTDREIGRIDPKIYGHFLESNFFGNIAGGLFDEDSPRARSGPGVRAGLRQDVIDVCREL
ncbi:MAG: hypothetical protein ACRDUA_03920, partial [Micromonosporaceae bacterium]